MQACYTRLHSVIQNHRSATKEMLLLLLLSLLVMLWLSLGYLYSNAVTCSLTLFCSALSFTLASPFSYFPKKNKKKRGAGERILLRCRAFSLLMLPVCMYMFLNIAFVNTFTQISITFSCRRS